MSKQKLMHGQVIIIHNHTLQQMYIFLFMFDSFRHLRSFCLSMSKYQIAHR